jgi:hypothetical protein
VHHPDDREQRVLERTWRDGHELTLAAPTDTHRPENLLLHKEIERHRRLS